MSLLKKINHTHVLLSGLGMGILSLSITATLLFWPMVEFYTWKAQSGGENPSTYQSKNNSKNNLEEQNVLYIPALNVATPINNTQNPDESLRDGVWMDPSSDNLAENGNTVVVGHRFVFNPNTESPFYHLHRLTKGDEIKVFWEGQEKTFMVSETLTVQPDAISTVYQDRRNTLTLYTCAPLFSNAQRLVVRAEKV